MNDKFLITLLQNVYEHLKLSYDFVLIITGDTGTGKSMLSLHIIELWYRVILGKEITPEHIKQINTDYKKWVVNFRDLEPYDINIYDEGATALDSKDAMNRLSKDLSKLFNVFRSKRFFTVIVLPSYFNLNKYFRENRLRSLMWVDKRGHYRFISKVGVKYLNAYNERTPFKNMNRGRPFFTGNFKDYNGILREPYEAMKDSGVDEILAQVIESTNNNMNVEKTLFELHNKTILKGRHDGKSYTTLAGELGIGLGTVHKIAKKLSAMGERI